METGACAFTRAVELARLQGPTARQFGVKTNTPKALPCTSPVWLERGVGGRRAVQDAPRDPLSSPKRSRPWPTGLEQKRHWCHMHGGKGLLMCDRGPCCDRVGFEPNALEMGVFDHETDAQAAAASRNPCRHRFPARLLVLVTPADGAALLCSLPHNKHAKLETHTHTHTEKQDCARPVKLLNGSRKRSRSVATRTLETSNPPEFVVCEPATLTARVTLKAQMIPRLPPCVQ